MKSITETMITIAATFLVLMFLTPILGVLFGAFGAWVIGLFFGDTILLGFQRFGIDTTGWSMWQLGVFFGFVGGFFKATLTK